MPKICDSCEFYSTENTPTVCPKCDKPLKMTFLPPAGQAADPLPNVHNKEERIRRRSVNWPVIGIILGTLVGGGFLAVWVGRAIYREYEIESLMKQCIAEMNALSAALEKKESPEHLKAAAEKLKDTMEKLDKMKISKERQEELGKKYGKELFEALVRMLMAAEANPQGAKSIQDTMKAAASRQKAP